MYAICHFSKFHIWSLIEAFMCKTWFFFKFPQTVSIFNLWQSFKLKLKLEYIRKKSHESQIMTIFVSTLYLKNWPSYALLFNLVTSSKTSWVCNTYLSQLRIPIYIPANIVCVAPVLHSQIVWKIIMTNTQTIKHKHTGVNNEACLLLQYQFYRSTH